jgi:hypothetical protein
MTDTLHPDLADLLALEREGGCSDGDFMAALVDLGGAHGFDDLVGALPEPLATRFVVWARAMYNNDVPAEQFFHVGAARAPAEVAAQVGHVRAWLHAAAGLHLAVTTDPILDAIQSARSAPSRSTSLPTARREAAGCQRSGMPT